MAKQRQFDPRTNPSKSVPDYPNIVLVDRCHPEKIIETLTAKYFQDLSAFYGYASPTLDEVRDFTRALVSGDIDLDSIPLAREVAESSLSKADTEDGKEFTIALVEIAQRHNAPFSIDEEIATRLFNRGLLPLFSLAPNQQTLNAISKESGLSIRRVTEVLFKIEQSDAELRSITLAQLCEPFIEEKRLRATNGTSSSSKQRSKNGTGGHNPPKTPPPIKKPDYKAAELRLRAIIEAATRLTLDTSIMSELIDRRILGKEPDLPVVASFVASNEEDVAPLRIDMNPTNFWLDAALTSKTPGSFPAPAKGMPIEKAIAAIPVDEHATRTFISILKARTTDVFIESAIVNTTARFLLEAAPRNEDFLKAIKDLEKVIGGIDAIHKNSILAIRDVDAFKERIANTDRSWRKLANNPVLANRDHTEYGSIDLNDVSKFGPNAVVLAAMIYHLPPGIAESLFANTFGGMIWDLKGIQFQDRLEELAAIDPTGILMDQARGWRTRCSATGSNIVTKDQKLGLEFKDKDELVRVFRPVSKRYDPLFTKDSKTMDRDLAEISMANPAQVNAQSPETPQVGER